MNDGCGIYKIINIVTGDYYIGSSCNIRRRTMNHRSDLAKNIHSNSRLQNAWNKYGEQAFEFTTVLLCSREDKLHFEQRFLDMFNPAYNIAVCAAYPGQGLHPSEETKRKLSEVQKGRQFSEEHKRKISEAKKGKYPSKETRAKLSEVRKGKHPSEETRKKMGEWQKGKHFSKETCAKISESKKRYYAEKRHEDN